MNLDKFRGEPFHRKQHERSDVRIRSEAHIIQQTHILASTFVVVIRERIKPANVYPGFIKQKTFDTSRGPAISITKGVDADKQKVCHYCSNDRIERFASVIVQPLDEPRHQSRNLFVPWRLKARYVYSLLSILAWLVMLVVDTPSKYLVKPAYQLLGQPHSRICPQNMFDETQQIVRIPYLPLFSLSGCWQDTRFGIRSQNIRNLFFGQLGAFYARRPTNRSNDVKPM